MPGEIHVSEDVAVGAAEEPEYDAEDLRIESEREGDLRAKLHRLTSTVRHLEQDNADMEQRVASNAEVIAAHKISIAEVMNELAIKDTEKGLGRLRVTLEPVTHASVKKENRAFVARWLNDNGYGALLSTRYTIDVPVKSEMIVKQLDELLERSLPAWGITLTVDTNKYSEAFAAAVVNLLSVIAPQPKLDKDYSWSGSSLGKVIRERVLSGKPVPEQVGYFNMDEVVITERAV